MSMFDKGMEVYINPSGYAVMVGQKRRWLINTIKFLARYT